MNDFFHWLGQPYHVPDYLSTNGTFIGLLVVALLCMWVGGYLQGRFPAR